MRILILPVNTKPLALAGDIFSENYKEIVVSVIGGLELNDSSNTRFGREQSGVCFAKPFLIFLFQHRRGTRGIAE